MDDIKKKLAKLIDVKSITTILLVLTFIYLCVARSTIPTELNDLVKMALLFYFGTQVGKKETTVENKTNN
jgi:hypothetical protein